MSLLTRLLSPKQDTADEILHIYCCDNEDLGLCGLDLSDHVITNKGQDCVVCIDLDSDICPHTGLPCPDRKES